LKSATNPESGTVSYAYDENSNLATKTDARSISTTFTYDRLNRVTLKNYSGSTPDVTFYYDNLTNGKGKLKKMTSSASTTEYTGYDISGRVTSHKQTTDSVDYTTGYTYSLSGQLLEETYPSGRVVKNTFDAIDGSLSQVQSKRSAETYRNFANGFIYNPSGSVTAMRLGNGLWENTVFNSRLQPTQIGVGTGVGSQSKLKIAYGYGTTDNNGNVQTQTITVPGFAHTFNQTYTYDSLNRLSYAEEIVNSEQYWEQGFKYDRYGNRRFDEPNTSTIEKECDDLVCEAHLPQINPTINSNNQLNGSYYDESGNVIGDAWDREFSYDAEGRMTDAIESGPTVGQYTYDGDGRRVKKRDPVSGETTVFVYDASGRLIAEYDTTIQTGANAKTVYTTTDPLGSPRLNTDGVGAVVARHDYHPFGEPVLPSVGRNSGVGYVSDTIRKKFTGYEHDEETGLDFAQARYLNSSFGRFSSPDPIYISAIRVIDPQLWNGYTYTGNNPLKYVDPLGEERIKLKESSSDLEQQRIIEKQKKEQMIKAKDAATNKADKKKLQGDIDKQNKVLKTLNIKIEGTKAVEQIIAHANTEPGQRTLQLSDFELTTDPLKDFAAVFTNPSELATAADSQAFVVKGSNTITIPTNSTNPLNFYYMLWTGDADGALIGGGVAIHEDYHRANPNAPEKPAYGEELKFLNRTKKQFKNSATWQERINTVQPRS
jgi:RHS repeat-associated protein